MTKKPEATVTPRGHLKSFRCLIGWHVKPFLVASNDGCSDHAECKVCGFQGMIDSQGNLF